jgi:hypothetical protein
MSELTDLHAAFQIVLNHKVRHDDIYLVIRSYNFFSFTNRRSRDYLLYVLICQSFRKPLLTSDAERGRYRNSGYAKQQ